MNILNLNITEQQLPVITFNFEEMKEALKVRLSEYSGLVVTDENLSICKAQQKDLAGMRIKIDTYRKDTKKEMSKPIDEFEDKCKQLIRLVEDAEKPLKEGIQVFDDKKRDEKRKIAEQIIQAIVEEKGLEEKYAKRLTVLDKYTLLGAKASEVREDVEQRAFILLGEQNKEKEMQEIIQDTIDNANKNIKAQMKIEDFQRLIDRGMSPKDVIGEINARAEQIRLAENPPPEPEPTPETTPAPEPNRNQPPPEQETGPGKDENIYFVELRIVETREGIGKLSELLKSNGIVYTVLRKSKVE
jgi:hypothetical protein